MSLDGELTAAFYAAVTSDHAFVDALALLARRFRCSSAALVYVDPERPTARISLSHGVAADPETQRRYAEDYGRDDPAPAAMAKLRLGQAAATGRLFSAAFTRQSRFIQEFYHPLGLREALGGPIAEEAGRFGILAVQRGEERGSFDDDDIAAFESILPHVIRVAELRRGFFEIEARAKSLEVTLDSGMAGILVFDGAGHLVHGNKAARAMLDRRDIVMLDREGRLRAVTPDADGSIQRAFAAGVASGPAIVRLPRRDGSTGLVAAIRSRRGAAGDRDGLSIHLSDPERHSGDVAAALAQALGLRGPAARLVLALLHGEDLASYAERTRVSLATVKSHLAAAFAATGCRRQVDLVRVAGAIVHDLALGSTSS